MAYTGEGGMTDIRGRIAREMGQVTIGSNGQPTITFTRAFPNEPRIVAMAYNTGGNPIIVETLTKAGSGSTWTGATLKAYRLMPLPSLTGLLLTQLITALTGYAIPQNNALSGVKVDWLAF